MLKKFKLSTGVFVIQKINNNLQIFTIYIFEIYDE
jgi:hypothetical protein